MAPPRLKLAKKNTNSKLVDVGDYLEVGDSHEEAMRKHRGGDPAKALRFADRALDVYSQGLAKFPRNFDLAYNKARLELEKATDSILSQALDVPVISVLQQALGSHRYARDLEPTHTDTQFNMAQVLTAMAETIAEGYEDHDLEALHNIEQALEIQGHCFQLQQAAFTKNRLEFEQAMQQTAEDQTSHIDGGQAPADTVSGAQNASQEEQWVSIEEPITAETLLDTIIAQLEALSVLCSIASSSLAVSPESGNVSVMTLTWVDSYSTKVLMETLPTLINENRDILEPRLSDVMLSKAVFTGNYLELSLRLFIIDVDRYKQGLDAAFAQRELDTNSEEVLMAGARALFSFNSALFDLANANETGPSPEAHAALRWKLLVQAQSRLAAVANLPNTDKHTVAVTHVLRGDASLCLQMLAYPPAAFPQARTTAQQLLTHAEVYYRNASKLFGTLGRSASEDKSVCELKGAVVSVLKQVTTSQEAAGSSSGQDNSGSTIGTSASPDQIERALGPIIKVQGEKWVRDYMESMIDEGLILPEVFSAVLRG
ncbi:hypothetical protein F4861DRAFT_489400 [Xylaria intraflava]|nr:hypothetical protein F4861DRAFT_489400 [Xylaria intraflava]